MCDLIVFFFIPTKYIEFKTNRINRKNLQMNNSAMDFLETYV